MCSHRKCGSCAIEDTEGNSVLRPYTSALTLPTRDVSSNKTKHGSRSPNDTRSPYARVVHDSNDVNVTGNAKDTNNVADIEGISASLVDDLHNDMPDSSATSLEVAWGKATTRDEGNQEAKVEPREPSRALFQSRLVLELPSAVVPMSRSAKDNEDTTGSKVKGHSIFNDAGLGASILAGTHAIAHSTSLHKLSRQQRHPSVKNTDRARLKKRDPLVENTNQARLKKRDPLGETTNQVRLEKQYPSLDDTDRARLENRDDTVSTVSIRSQSMDSIFSTESRETSATELSKESGFSIEQIESATRVFFSILQNDELLAPLYEPAQKNADIGPNRLRRHARRALKTFAENLELESDDHFEFQASQLVHAKARYAARYIAYGEDISHQPYASGFQRGQASKDLEDSSEDEMDERSVQGTELRDLKAFRRFLTESDAYTTLRENIRAFCVDDPTMSQDIQAIEKPESWNPERSYLPTIEMPKLSAMEKLESFAIEMPNLPPAPEGDKKRTWHAWQEDTETLARSLLLGFDRSLGAKAAMFLLLDAAFLLTDDIFIALGWLEPSLEVGRTRLRSLCVSTCNEAVSS